MTVRELIAKLQEFDQDMRVVIDGNEGGVAEVKFVQSVNIALNMNQSWYYGEHEPVDDDFLTDEEKQQHEVVTAVYLPR